MLKRISMFAIFLVILCSVCLSAQDNPEQASREAASRLFDLARSKNYESASKLLAVVEKDNKRQYKDHYNYQIPDEREAVVRLVKKIKAFLDISDSHSFSEFSQGNLKGVDCYRIAVQFRSGSQALSTQFSFVKTSAGLLLAEIN